MKGNVVEQVYKYEPRNGTEGDNRKRKREHVLLIQYPY
jgi:hypothetical protein